MRSLYVMVSGEKNIPASHTVPVERHRTRRTIELSGQFYVGWTTPPSLH